jgi:hypothetical protein
MQAVDFLCHRAARLALIENPACQVQGMTEDVLQLIVAHNLSTNIAVGAALAELIAVSVLS